MHRFFFSTGTWRIEVNYQDSEKGMTITKVWALFPAGKINGGPRVMATCYTDRKVASDTVKVSQGVWWVLFLTHTLLVESEGLHIHRVSLLHEWRRGICLQGESCRTDPALTTSTVLQPCSWLGLTGTSSAQELLCLQQLIQVLLGFLIFKGKFSNFYAVQTSCKELLCSQKRGSS